MHFFEDEVFDSDSFTELGTATTYSDIEFKKCLFKGCSISMTSRPDFRSKVRNVRLINCSQRGSSLGAAILEDVFVDGLTTNGQLFQSWGAVFNRVVLQGKIDRVMISNDVLPSVLLNQVERDRELEQFREANAEFYRHVEWALDISNGEFKELCIRGLPGNLVQRDADTQFLVTREKALMGKWRTLDFQETLWPVALELFLQRGESSIILAAPKRHPKFKEYLDDLMKLQDVGVASN